MQQSYEVESRAPGPRRRVVALPLVAALGVLAVGLLGQGSPRPANPPAASPEGSAVAEVASGQDAVPGPPRVVDCGDMPAFECPAAVLAAREAMAPADVTIDSARAWTTLLCGDELDCPRPLLASSDPVGSVTFSLAGGRGEVWVNVVRVPAPNRLNENRERLVAQVIRWFRAPG